MIYVVMLLSCVVVVQGIFLLFLVRQIGLILLRIPPDDTSSEMSVGQVSTNLSGVAQSLISKSGSLFVFASFSCPLCQPILESIHVLNPKIKERLSLMLLEPDLMSEVVLAKLKEFKLDDVHIINGFDYVKAFGIKRTPFLVEIDATSTVVKREFLREFDQIGA